MPCRLQGCNEEPAVAGWALDADDCIAGVISCEPGKQLPHPFRAIGEAERGDLVAALVQQRSDVGALVHVDPDDHWVLLSRG